MNAIKTGIIQSLKFSSRVPDSLPEIQNSHHREHAWIDAFIVEDASGNITRIPMLDGESMNAAVLISEHGKAIRDEETSREVEVIVRAGE